jgi:hypothetical protein
MRGSTGATALFGLMVALSLHGSSPPARGSLVTWEFGGEITRVVDNQGFFGGAVDLGTPFFVRYTFESDTPDAEAGDPTRGVYAAVTELSGHIGTLPFGIADGPGRIGVRLQSPANASQAYGLSASAQILGAEAEVYMTLRDTSATAFSTDALPILPLDLGAFDTSVFTLDPTEKGIVAEGTVTSLVPEPTTLALLGLGALALIGKTRRRRLKAVRPPAHPCARIHGFVTLLAASAAINAALCPTARAVDCNDNEINDECDMNCDFARCHTEPCGGIPDCNQNRIPDQCDIGGCDPIEIVFLLDISSSLGTETPITAVELCASIIDALNDPILAPVTVSAEVLAMGTPVGDDTPCPCCCADLSGCESNEELFAGKYGTRTCALTNSFGDCAGIGNRNDEDWGNATAIVAANKNWGPGPRIVVPISDEGPRCGDPIDEFDDDVIDEVVPVVGCHRVIVSPVVDVSDQDLRQLAVELRDGGVPGGAVLDITDAHLAARLVKMIRAACPSDCNANGVPDSCDIANGTSRDCFHHCCAPHATPGCADPVVEAEVCAETGLSGCCTTEWTSACAASAETLGHCDSGDGIPDDCQTDGPDCDESGPPDTCQAACAPSARPWGRRIAPRTSSFA